MSNEETKLLLSCLAVLLRRCRGTVVIEEDEIERAQDSLDEFTWKRNAPTKTLRLSVPMVDRG
jgi:hypothetical protein